MTSPKHMPPSFWCVHCQNFLVIQNLQITEHYFRGVQIHCPNCGAGLDWWDLAIRNIRENAWPGQVFALIGAQTTLTSIKLIPEESFELKLAKLGIPQDAKVLDINYTSQDSGGLSAVESHGNAPHRFKHEIRHDIVLHPIPFRYAEPIGETEVAILITWVPHTANDEAWNSLIDAFRAYYSHQYQSGIIPANVAIEARLSRLLGSFLEQFVGRDRTKRFLDDAAPYSHQLNVLLPVFATLKGVPLLPDNIRGQLNRLRDHRNDIAHKGKTECELTNEDAANCFCAALFGFHYINLIESEILGN